MRSSFLYCSIALSRGPPARANNLRAHLRLHPRSRLRGCVDGQHVSYGCQRRSASVRTSTDISLFLLASPITSKLFLEAVLSKPGRSNVSQNTWVQHGTVRSPNVNIATNDRNARRGKLMPQASMANAIRDLKWQCACRCGQNGPSESVDLRKVHEPAQHSP